MKYTFEFDEAAGPQDVTITVTGEVTRRELLELIDALTSDERFEPGMLILIDDTAVDARLVTGDDVRVFADALIRNERIGRGAAAIVAPAGLTFGFARMLEAHAPKLRLRAFPTHEEAAAWLATLRP